MSKNNDYTTANLLDYESFSNHCKLIATDLSKQTILENPDLKQQISFIGKLKEDNGATMFFIIQNAEQTTFSFAFFFFSKYFLFEYHIRLKHKRS